MTLRLSRKSTPLSRRKSRFMPWLRAGCRPAAESAWDTASYGQCWTALLAIGGFVVLFGGQILGGLVVLILAAIAGRYDYRIWTWQARRLLFFIIW
jgi:hypothetical protein